MINFIAVYAFPGTGGTAVARDAPVRCAIMSTVRVLSTGLMPKASYLLPLSMLLRRALPPMCHLS